MFKRAILSGVLVVSLVAIADAGSIWNWGWRCCSFLTGDISLKGAPNPDKKPTVVIADMTLDLEAICKNPGGGAHSEQVIHFIREAKVDVPLANGQADDNGKIVVTINLDLDALVGVEACTGGSGDWTVLEDSIGVTGATITQNWFRCTGDLDDPNEGPCFDDVGGELIPTISAKAIDIVSIICTLDPLLRNPDLTVQHNQKLECPEV